MMENFIADVTKDMSPEELEAANSIQCDEYGIYFDCKSKPPLINIYHDDVAWIWEMDLDPFEVFLNDYSPTKNDFLRSNTEELSKHAYVHKIVPRPSEEDPATLQNHSLFCTGMAPLHEILGVEETLSHTETLRLHWVEILVGCARNPGARWVQTEHVVLKLEANGGASALDAIPARTCSKLKDLIYQIFRPYFYGLSYHRIGREAGRTLPGCPNLYLLRHNTVFCIQNHLDDPNCLHTSSYNFFKAIMDNFATPISQEPFVYGVLFSGTRCAIVRVDRKKAKFTHTVTMTFFPNDFKSRSSAGITALARLASKIDPDCFQFGGRLLSSRGGLFEKLPPELIDMIADFCSHDFLHLCRFAHISTCTRDAALNASVRYIFIDGSRLVKAIDKASLGFGENILEYLKENESCSGLFCLETAQNRRALCIVGYEGGSCSDPNPPFGINTLKPANEMGYGLFSLEGNQMS
ncbi:hypothetical protein L218DRAFT_960769 [Marasmius fiardii PR-910]|nr:hypothetical protein L218DRAFT_960769 [Marasmius fiardii PR-910]